MLARAARGGRAGGAACVRFSLTHVGSRRVPQSAFQDCTSLASVNIGGSVTSIGQVRRYCAGRRFTPPP